MQFHLIVVSIFLKTCVKDRGDISSRLLERRIWLVCFEAHSQKGIGKQWKNSSNFKAFFCTKNQEIMIFTAKNKTYYMWLFFHCLPIPFCEFRHVTAGRLVCRWCIFITIIIIVVVVFQLFAGDNKKNYNNNNNNTITVKLMSLARLLLSS